MDSKEAWNLFGTIFGSGAIFSFLTWLITKVRQSGADDANYKAQCKEVKSMKEHQAEQDIAIRKLEKRMEEIDHNIDVRLSSIEIELTHVRELQVAHNADLRTASEDIKSLLRYSQKE